MKRLAKRGFLGTAGLVLVVAGSAAGQPGLEQVEEMTRLGRAEEARAALLTWWDGERDDASRRELQRGLWLRARLTVDPVQAELDFQRLVVLYPRGQFTPQAILRLAQSAYARGDEEGARRHVGTLVRDYANSPARDEAEAWLSSAGPVPPAPDTPIRPPTEEAGRPPTGARLDSTAAQAADTIRATETIQVPQRASPTEPAVAPEMLYYVQLGAFADEERAMTLYEEVSAAGVDVRVVRVAGSRFLHVRVGEFAAREAAVEALDALTEAGINAALVRDDRAEEVVRD